MGWASLEHNMVCWGAQSYCHVKGVGVLGWGAVQYWLNICLQAAMHYEEGDGAGRSSKPQSSSGPQGQRLPEQRGPLEGPLPDASSLDQEKQIMLLLGAKPALSV